MIAPNRSIEVFAALYLSTRDVCESYAKTLLARCQKFTEWHLAEFGRSPTIDDLEFRTVNSWLESAQKRGLAQWTVSGYRRNLLAIWRFAYQEGETNEPPLRVRRIRICERPVTAWTLDEIRELDSAASELSGEYGPGIQCSVFWQAMIHAAYSTGLRRGDLLGLQRTQIAPDGVIEVPQHKTGSIVRTRLSTHARAMVDKMAESGDPRAFPWDEHLNTLNSHFKRLVKSARIRPGTLRWLRRSAGSYADMVQPGSGPRLLGHRDCRTFSRFYEDRSITGKLPPSPPEL